MQMENFIDGFPGSEHGLRRRLAETLGAGRAHFLCERLLDHFFAEEDVVFLAGCGVNVLRLPFNYRHLENDAAPFVYLEAGFARLDRALDWCARHGLRAILDLHAVQGWQNPDWHCDNQTRHALLWEHPHFQDRFVALWVEIARRYRGNGTVAAYDVMNEPSTGHPLAPPDWDALNRLQRRVVAAIREVDPDHIVVLEGDSFASRFAGLDPPFDANLVYSSHNYTDPGFGPGVYPGRFRGRRWDRARHASVLRSQEGTRFAREHDVPLWVGEFGSVYNGPADEVGDRLRSLDDQIGVLEEEGVHWTLWTYKDAGVMGWVTLDPECEYLGMVGRLLAEKLELATDSWMGWLPPRSAQRSLHRLARRVDTACGEERPDRRRTRELLSATLLSDCVGALLQPSWARLFRGLSEERLDDILSGFALRHCVPNTGLLDIVRRHTGADRVAA
jgi:hypothetical protein